MPRARDLNLVFGELPPGLLNALTDVAGVRVGHTTLIAGEGPLRPGQGLARTGSTLSHGSGDSSSPSPSPVGHPASCQNPRMDVSSL